MSLAQYICLEKSPTSFQNLQRQKGNNLWLLDCGEEQTGPTKLCESLPWIRHLYCKSETVRDFTVQHLFRRPASSSDAPSPYGRTMEVTQPDELICTDAG